MHEQEINTVFHYLCSTTSSMGGKAIAATEDIRAFLLTRPAGSSGSLDIFKYISLF